MSSRDFHCSVFLHEKIIMGDFIGLLMFILLMGKKKLSVYVVWLFDLMRVRDRVDVI